MSTIVGFGVAEDRAENEEFDRIKEFAEAEYIRLGCEYVTDELAKSVERFVRERDAELKAIADGYTTAETYLTRYSYFWPTVLHDASHIVCILRFSHINRRHPFSPDGWAMISTGPCRVVLRSIDVDMKKRATA